MGLSHARARERTELHWSGWESNNGPRVWMGLRPTRVGGNLRMGLQEREESWEWDPTILGCSCKHGG